MLTHSSEQLARTPEQLAHTPEQLAGTPEQLSDQDIKKIKEKLNELYTLIYNEMKIPFPSDSKFHKKVVKPEDFEVNIYYISWTKDGNTKKILVIVFGPGPLSNWFPVYIHDNDKYIYNSAEQMFINKKSDYSNANSKNEQILREINEATCPRVIQQKGREFDMNITEWNENSNRHLTETICLKFSQNPNFLKFLEILHQNNIYIIEGTEDKKYGMGLKFDPANPDHLNSTNWPGDMELTYIYENVKKALFSPK